MSNFRPIARKTGFLLPPSVDDWLPEKHLARFVVELIYSLDLSAISRAYRGSGSANYHPRLWALLYTATPPACFPAASWNRRPMTRLGVRFIAANDHPDHDTIATFRRRFLKEIEGPFVQILLLAREMGLLKMGMVALDGTKIHANASRHSAFIVAEAADKANRLDDLSIPDELARHEERLKKLAEAKVMI
jgi:transposase